MFVASQKRKENIAEYLLYMWQIEDIIRAYDLDISKIEESIVAKSNLGDEEKKQLTQWYESLIDMMRSEGVQKTGHLQLNKNILGQMVDMHRQLLADPKESEYHSQFYKVLPYIVELRNRAGGEKAGEIETCFNALYGLLMMRLQGKEVSADTTKAMTEISRLIALLAAKYHKAEENPEPME